MPETLQPFEARCEQLAEKLNLHKQWKSQIEILNSAKILEILPDKHKLGIIGIDGKEYPIPRYEDILKRITPENLDMLEKKYEQGFSKMLIVPFGMPIEILADRMKRAILAKFKPKEPGSSEPADDSELLSTDKDGKVIKLPVIYDNDKKQYEPLYVNTMYQQSDYDNKMVYHPVSLDKNDHKGQFKQDILDHQNHNQGHNTPGFHIVFVEDNPIIPKKGENIVKGGRVRIQAGLSPNEYLELLQTDPQYDHEQGFTTEDWITYFISILEETNHVIDDYQGQGKACYNIGSFDTADSYVSRGDWRRNVARAFLSGDFPGFDLDYYGCRSSVKI